MSVQSTVEVSGHRIPQEVLDQVFAGPVDDSAIATLRAGHHSRRMLLLKVLRDLSLSTVGPDDENGDIHSAWRILVAAEKRDPAVTREILAYPPVGAWLVRAIRKIRGIIKDDVPTWVDSRYLNSIVAAAALRTGIDCTVDVPVWRGRVSLPTIGLYTIAGEGATHMVRLRVAESAAFVESGQDSRVPLGEFAAFPLRHHESTVKGRTVRWTIDDIDPYRTSVALEGPRRLDATEFGDWCRQLDEAWAILVAEHGEHVREVVAVEPAIVPVPPCGGLVASTSVAAFGAIRLTPHATSAALAETVLHELQHSKLNALLDLVPLERSDSTRLFYAPWRRDPRPLSGLLHGLYAFAGVVEYWRRRLSAHPDDGAAIFQFAYNREQLRAALAWLGPTPELTESGEGFLAVVRARFAACEKITVPEGTFDTIATASAVNRLGWRLRHLDPSPDHVTRLAERWLAGARPDVGADEPCVRSFCRDDVTSSVEDLLTTYQFDPDRAPAAGSEWELVLGAHDEAVTAFAHRVAADVEDDAAWVGLLLASNAADLPPEIVAATARRIQVLGGAPPDPVTLVTWFADR